MHTSTNNGNSTFIMSYACQKNITVKEETILLTRGSLVTLV